MRPTRPLTIAAAAAAATAVSAAALSLGGPASAGDATTSSTEVQARYHPRTGLVDGQTNAEAASCSDYNRKVRIERARTGRIVARTTTERDSTFRFRGVHLRPGRYVVAAPEDAVGGDDGPLTCLRGKSRVFGVAARP